MKQIPKFQQKGKLPFINSEIEKWVNDWQWRLTPESRSKVLREWRRTGEKPKAETSQEYTKRRIKEATKPDKVDKALNTAADIAHGVGTEGMTAALAGSLVLNPLGTLGALAGGIVGGKAVDKASQAFTGKTWAENVVDRLGLQTPTLAEFTNPGMWVGGGIGSGITGEVIPILIRMDMPRFGYKPTTEQYFKPGYVGMNGVAAERRPISYGYNRESVANAAKEEFAEEHRHHRDTGTDGGREHRALL